MWNISVRVLLLFVPVLFANVSTNDCHTKGYRNVSIHACQDSSFSGPIVALDASMISESDCECTLTINRSTCSENFAFVEVIYADNNHRIKFSVDNITYTNTSGFKQHNFNGDFIRVVVEKTYTGRTGLRTGNPCMIFRVKDDSGCILTLSCSNVIDLDPGQNENKTYTAKSEIEKITTQLQQSTRQTVPALTTTITVITTKKKTPTNTTTDPVKVSTNNPDLSSTTLYDIETTISVIQDFTIQPNILQENGPTKSGGTTTVIIIVVVTVVCTAIVIVLITCYCKRRNRSPIKSDVNTIKPRKQDVYEVTENAMYVPMELLNEPNYTQGSTEHVYDQPDIDIIANRAHENETKPLLQGQPASVHENDVKCTVEQSEGDDTDITAVADSVKHNRESQDHTTNEQKEQLYTQVDKIKSNNTMSASTEHIYDVSG